MSIRLMFAAGSADDPAGCEGLAALTGALLAEGGTRAVTYEQLLAELYPMAAGIGVHVDRDVTVVHGTVHRDHLDRYYDLVRQVVLEPRWETSSPSRARAFRILLTIGTGRSEEWASSRAFCGVPLGRLASWAIRTMP